MTKSTWIMLAMAIVAVIGFVQEPAQAKKACGAKGAQKCEEVEVTIDQVPAAVKKTILSQAGKNKIEEIEKKTKNGKVTYEAEWTEGEMEVEITVAPDGKLLKTEKEPKDDDDDDDD